MRKLIFATILAVSFLTLFSCSSNETELSEIVKGGISKISSRHSGNGALYSTTDKEKIVRFIKIMSSTTYSKVKAYEAITGNSSLELYNENNEIITSITSNGKGVYNIGGGYYKMNKDISAELSSFYKELYSEENIVKE